MTITHYLRSDGTSVPIDDMDHNHLRFATVKLDSVVAIHPDRAGELAAMRTRLAYLDEQFRAKVEALRSEGFDVHTLGPNAYVGVGPLGTHVTTIRKSENSAWGQILSARENDQ